ncbi:MAG: TolC family protein, partial [Gammaproteobacteria bacterium]
PWLAVTTWTPPPDSGGEVWRERRVNSMKYHKPLLLGVLLALLLGSLAASAADATGGRGQASLSLDHAVAMALAGNPGLAAIEARARALEELPAQKGTLPDPQLLFNLMNLPVDTFSFSQEAMTQVQIGISQMLPYPGKLALQEEVATLEASAADDKVAEMRLRLVRDVRTLWWTLYYLDRALEVVASNQELLRQFVTIAQTKYKVGKGLQQDVLLAQVELSKLLDREIALQGMRRIMAARLNALLDRQVDTVVRLVRQVDESLPELARDGMLYQAAEDSRPLLRQQSRQIEAARLRRDLAKKDYYPDFRVGALYGFRSGENPNGSSRADFATFMFSMNLPIYAGSRQDRKLDQRNSELSRERYTFSDLRSRVAAEIATALADYQRARQQASLFREGIIPQATQTVASMRAGYQVNKVDFLNLVRAQITLFNYQVQYWKALSEANQARARVTAAVGKETVYE